MFAAEKRPSIEELIALWHLKPMETEQVLFSQTYTDSRKDSNGKPLSTAIVAMLTSDVQSFSDMHRLPTDEIWHFYFGDAIELLLLYPSGNSDIKILGQNVLGGQEIQYVVPAGVWMGARLRQGGEYAVFGNTMAPGYSQSDFEGGSAEELANEWPEHAEFIRALTRTKE